MLIVIFLGTLSAVSGQDLYTACAPSFPTTGASFAPGFATVFGITYPTVHQFTAPVINSSPVLTSSLNLQDINIATSPSSSPAAQTSRVSEDPVLPVSSIQQDTFTGPGQLQPVSIIGTHGAAAFVADVFNIISTNDELKNVFNLQELSTPQQLDAHFRYLRSNLQDLGIPYPSNTARLITQSISSVIGNLSSASYAIARLKTLGNFLEAHGKLTIGNAAYLARQYTTILQNAVRSTNAAGNSPLGYETYLSTVPIFIISLGVPLFQQNVDEITQRIAEELNAAKNNPGPQRWQTWQKTEI